MIPEPVTDQARGIIMEIALSKVVLFNRFGITIPFLSVVNTNVPSSNSILHSR